MKQCLVLPSAFAVAIALALVCPDPTSTAQETKSTVSEKMATVNYLVGTWNCTHSVGGFAGKYTTKYTMTLGDRWLRQTYDFPPGQFGSKDGPAVTAEAMIGYDEKRSQWVRFFTASSGDYFPIRMKESPAGWDYTYTSFFRGRPETPPTPDATFTKKTDTEYSIDGPTYPEGGTQVTEHHSCHKM